MALSELGSQISDAQVADLVDFSLFWYNAYVMLLYSKRPINQIARL